MISFAKVCAPAAQKNEQFEQMIPAITRIAQHDLRNLSPCDRQEAIHEILASAFCAYSRLVDRGRLDAAFATPLARFAIAHYRAGRRVGAKLSTKDVASPVAQRQRGFSLESLQTRSPGSTVWGDLLADDTLTPIPDQVAFRLDFPEWLRSQAQSKRQIAQFLALGNTPAETAEHFRVTQARVCQIRRQLRTSWRAYQGQD